MKKDMVRASIYIERSIWQGIREEAHEKWIPIGKLIAELYESREVHKVHKLQVSEKATETKIPEKVGSPSPTGECLPCAKKESKEKASGLGDTKKKVKKVIEEIPGVESASDYFHPQPKGKK